jgi:hypothetical protein
MSQSPPVQPARVPACPGDAGVPEDLLDVELADWLAAVATCRAPG